MKRGWKNKAQMTIFVIIAILLMGIVAISFFAFKKTSSFNSQFSYDNDVNAKFSQVKASIEDCMTISSKDALTAIGYQGGYYNIPKGSFDLGWTFIPYYYDNGKFLMPSILDIQKNLGLSVDNDLIDCLKDIDTGEFKITYSKSSTLVNIDKGEVIFAIDMPISIWRDERTMRLELRDSPVVIDSKLFEMIEIAKFITDAHKEDSKKICINCVLNLAEERELIVNNGGFGDNIALVSIVNNNTDYSPGLFQFLNKYSVNN